MKRSYTPDPRLGISKENGRWGHLFCPYVDRNGRQIEINGVPNNDADHARQILRAVARCPHMARQDDDKTYEFSIVASKLDPDPGNFGTRFYEAGCADARVAFQNGRIIIDFAREAHSIDEAIASATENVRSAVDRVERDPLVSL